MARTPQLEAQPEQYPLFDTGGAANRIARAQQTRRKGFRMHARRGQDGNVEIRNGAYWGRYWKDQSDGTRTRPRVKLATVKSMTYSEAQRMWSQRLEEMGVNSIETFKRTVGPTFRQQAEEWFKQMQTRRRKPVKPSVLVSWRGALNNHLLPLIGDLPMADVHNGAYKTVVAALIEKGLAAETIDTYCQPLKMIVNGAKNEKGESLYPVKWDNEFADLPIVRPEDQHRPSITAEEIERGLAECRTREKLLVTLLGATGLRIGEALALQVRHVSSDGRMIQVRQGLWVRNIQRLKTESAKRDVDVSEGVAEILARQIAGRSETEYLFATRAGRKLSVRNVARTIELHFGLGGFHRLRRFRAERIREAEIPTHLEKFWMGHSRGRDMSDHYAAKLLANVAYRRSWLAKVELGFRPPSLSWTHLTDPREENSAVDSHVVAENALVAVV